MKTIDSNRTATLKIVIRNVAIESRRDWIGRTINAGVIVREGSARNVDRVSRPLSHSRDGRTRYR